MLYIGDCRQLWEEAQTHYVNRQYEKARELLEKIARIDTAHHAQYLTGDMYLKGLGGEIDYDKALKLWLSGNFWLVSFKISYLCLPLFYETRTTPSCHPSGCAYRQL